MPEKLPPSESQDQFAADAAEALAAVRHVGLGREAMKRFVKDAVWSKN